MWSLLQTAGAIPSFLELLPPLSCYLFTGGFITVSVSSISAVLLQSQPPTKFLYISNHQPNSSTYPTTSQIPLHIVPTSWSRFFAHNEWPYMRSSSTHRIMFLFSLDASSISIMFILSLDRSLISILAVAVVLIVQHAFYDIHTIENIWITLVTDMSYYCSKWKVEGGDTVNIAVNIWISLVTDMSYVILLFKVEGGDRMNIAVNIWITLVTDMSYYCSKWKEVIRWTLLYRLPQSKASSLYNVVGCTF